MPMHDTRMSHTAGKSFANDLLVEQKLPCANEMTFVKIDGEIFRSVEENWAADEVGLSKKDTVRRLSVDPPAPIAREPLVPPTVCIEHIVIIR